MKKKSNTESKEIYKKDTLPAVPPEDYKGSIAGWITSLVQRGLFDDSNGSWYGDIDIPVDTWWEILEENEEDD